MVQPVIGGERILPTSNKTITEGLMHQEGRRRQRKRTGSGRGVEVGEEERSKRREKQEKVK